VNDVYALVRSLRENRFPRNRHFDEHATVHGAEARRVNRFLRAVEKDVLAADQVEVQREPEEEGGGWRVTLRFPSVRLCRVVSLTPDEHAILVEDPRIAARLG